MSSLFYKPNAIVYIRRGGLILAGKHIKPARLTFDEAAVSNLEVRDADRYGTILQDFFEGHGVKGQRILVVLDHSVVFTKSISLDNSGKPALLAKNFVDAMPFEPGIRACLSLKSPDTLRIFAANSELYQVLVDALHGAGASKIIAVTPVAAYGIREADKLSSSIVDQLLQDNTIRGKANFLSVAPE
jgi:hypothetical protein